MKVLVAERCGFCLGVKNAIAMAETALKTNKHIFSLGPVIHNDQVVEKLAQEGLQTVKKIEDIPSGTVLIRSHGATLAQLGEIEQKGLGIIDATCVLVKRVQKIAAQLNADGYKVVIIGDANHPEVQAVAGYATDVVVVNGPQDLESLEMHQKLGVICQTTQSPEYFAATVSEMVSRGFSEMKIINTLCGEAIKRQTSAVELCQRVDIMFVLGGLHSANTRKLAELCRKYNPQTYHLEDWKQLDKATLISKNTAGVTAGASTPDWVIAEFVEKLKSFQATD
jgi:(E)-4-hydroxy-3-methyl-but-2-enyl pyrophosphate reductase